MASVLFGVANKLTTTDTSSIGGESVCVITNI